MLYWPIREHPFVNYDDDVYITANAPVREGLSWRGVAWAFTTFHGANWFPVTWISWMADSQRGDVDPGAFHATDLWLHAATSALLYAALLRLSGRAAPSAFVAAVFAVHPLHVESVAWASARKDTLSGFWFACCLLVYAGTGVRPLTRRRLGALLGLLSLGLMSKPTLVTLPGVLVLLDAWPLRRLGRAGDPARIDPRALARALREKLPLFALAAAFSVVAFEAQRTGGSVVGLERLPAGARLANASVATGHYLLDAFWPADLAVFYPHPGRSLSALAVVAATSALLAVSLLATLGWRRRPYLLVGWLWFLGTLLPTLGLLQVGAQARADRYAYLPLAGIALAVTWGAAELGGGGRRRLALATAAAACLAALCLASVQQIRTWRSSEALFSHALRVTERNHVAHAHLGSALLERGRAAEAVRHWEQAVAIRPDFVRAANNLAWLLATHPDPALRDPERATRLAEAALPRADAERAALLDTLAAAHAAAGRFEAALAIGSRALARAEADGDAALAATVREHLARFRDASPWVEPP